MDVLVVDGYNIIGAWDELKILKQKDFDQARNRLIEILEEYRFLTKNRVIVVFDALYVKGLGNRHAINEVEVIYTREDETADECIERLVRSLKKVDNQVYVATSDYMEQRTIFSRGALRKSARELQMDLASMKTQINEQLDHFQQNKPRGTIQFDKEVKERLEQLRRGNGRKME